MTLADRFAQARRDRDDTPLDGGGSGRPPRGGDPFAELKRAVHQALLENLGPKLYDARLTQSEIEQKVRLTLQEVLAAEDTPLTLADRTRLAQEIADDILGYGPLEPYLRDVDVTEVMVNGPEHIYIERAGRIHPLRDVSPTRDTYGGRSTRSWAAWVVVSTKPARCVTRDCRTGVGSTPSSRRSQSTDPC